MRGVDTSAAVLPFRKSDENLPDAGRLITALRQIGYSLEQAIADLVDNSINAGASTVLIRFLHDENAIKAVAVVDDGAGMDEHGIRNAMRFGSLEAADVGTLGKFGMGLKLASLSHAQSLSVYSSTGAECSGRRWTLEGIRKGWMCERMRVGVTKEMLNRKWGPINLFESGTLVLWDELDKLPSHRRGLKYTLTSLESRLRLHLGLCFHRFLEAGSLQILVDQLLFTRIGQGMQSEIAPLNPFGYEESGDPEYPKWMVVELSGIGELEFEAHIWPAKCTVAEYRLGRRSAARQGFYFYRKNRLIQAGGWNGLFQDDSEPHGSLARVCIDLPPQYDADFGINVQKSTVLVPPVFGEILQARSADGWTFEDYRRAAISTYRNANANESNHAKFPANGFKKSILKQIEQIYGKNGNNVGFGVRLVKLRSDEFFRIDPDSQRLLINRNYVKGDSAVLTKLLLSLLLRKDIRELGGVKKKEFDAINDLLLSTLDFELRTRIGSESSLID